VKDMQVLGRHLVMPLCCIVGMMHTLHTSIRESLLSSCEPPSMATCNRDVQQCILCRAGSAL
jgi:hypothetical protein